MDDDWRSQAACLGLSPNLFFLPKGESVVHAKAVCLGCDVRAECLQYALANNEKFGVWGGLSEKERRRLRTGRSRRPGTRICDRCNARFLAQPTAKYCSAACRNVACRLGATG